MQIVFRKIRVSFNINLIIVKILSINLHYSINDKLREQTTDLFLK